jgi:hypothetical protein
MLVAPEQHGLPVARAVEGVGVDERRCARGERGALLRRERVVRAGEAGEGIGVHAGIVTEARL